MTWSQKTIARTATKKIAEIKASHPRCVSHSRGNDYIAHECSTADYAWRRVEEGAAKLQIDSSGKVTIYLRGGDWFELLPSITEEKITSMANNNAFALNDELMKKVGELASELTVDRDTVQERWDQRSETWQGSDEGNHVLAWIQNLDDLLDTLENLEKTP